MELIREHFRAIIFHNFRRGLSKQDCIDEVNALYSDKAPSYSTVKNWYNEFNRCRLSIQDEFRAGRPKSVVVPETIDAVRELIKQDRHVTYREIEVSLDISMTSINKILHEHLAVKKICSRWIPHNLTNAQKKASVDWCKEMVTKYAQGASKAVYNIYRGDESWIYAYEPETNQQSTEWVFQDEPNPTKVVRARSTSKQMVACFFGITGHMATVALEQRRTVNSEWYTTICLPEVIGEIRKNQKKRRIILHHDNASSHTSAQTKDFLKGQNIQLMGHPPYSPDLAPNDFFYSRTSKINYVDNDFRHRKKRLMHSKCMFWSYLNRSRKSASKIGSNACKSVLIFMENILKNNKTNFDHKYLFFHY